MQTALDYIDIENLKGRRISFLCGDAGPLAMATIISYKLGTKRPENLPDYKSLAQRYIINFDLNDSFIIQHCKIELGFSAFSHLIPTHILFLFLFPSYLLKTCIDINITFCKS